jgi:diguanylate cyclase (GGDEF)-like protein/PAS domain S-box-containing protein
MGQLLTTRRLLAGYAVWAVLLVAAHYAFGQWHAEVAVLTALSAVAAIVVGTVVNRPARRAPWLVLAAAISAGAMAVIAVRVQVDVSSAALPFPSWADGLDLIKYPLFVLALALFIRRRSGDRDRRSVVDAVILTVGLAVLFWLFLVVPNATDPFMTWPQRFVNAAYPVGDLLIVMALARLLGPGSWRGPSVWLLTIGTAAGIASDVAYDLAENSPGHHNVDGLLSLGWVIGGIACGAAALHPSMVELTRRGRGSDTATGSVIVLMIASLIPTIVLFIHAGQARDNVEAVVAIVVGVLYLLMLSRLWDVAALHRRSLVRERTLRLASVALASANSVEEVSAAVRNAAAGLIPRLPGQRTALLAVRDGDYLRQVDPPGATGPPRPLDPVRIWMQLAEGGVPRFVSMTEIRAARYRIVPEAPPPDAPSRYEGGLVVPLTLKDRPVGEPFIGVLGLFGDRRTLTDLTGALEILAGQAALAVERVGLTQEVVRQRGEALFRTLVQDASDVILIVGDDRQVRYATPSAVDIFGDVKVEGALLSDLVAPGSRADVDRVLDLMLTMTDAGASPGYLLRIERLDGRVAVLEVRWSDLREESTVGGLVLTLRDVTEQHELEEELKYRAFHDTLTALPNRALFVREAAAALEAARAVGRTAGVLFVDLDDFKVVNDTMGHGVGDELLVAVAARLAGTVRESDTAARLGGDEFALLIDDAADSAAVDAFAERIVAAFTEPFTLSTARVLASVTVGVATSADSGDVDELLRHADLALYAAKSAGKRRWRHYQPVLTTGMLRRREIQAALEDAVQSSAFTLVYQPIVGLTSGEIAGFESLVRWPHSRWGMMLPGQFIDLAEETGLIVPLGAWVLRQALADVMRWRHELRASAPKPPPPKPVPPPPGPFAPEAHSAVMQGYGTGPETFGPLPDGNRKGGGPAGNGSGPGEHSPVPGPLGAGPKDRDPHVSVNVSARQFRDPGFVDSVRQALAESGLPPAALLLELTESLLLGGNDRIRADLDELKEIGIRLAIDDFGTGYSSLSYLLDLPIDVLKIDKTFVTGISSSWRRHALVEGITRLARTLEVEVIAEGIESEIERELLAGMGCQFGQGYLLSVPVDAESAGSMLRLGRRLVTELPRPHRRSPDGRYLTDL